MKNMSKFFVSLTVLGIMACWDVDMCGATESKTNSSMIKKIAKNVFASEEEFNTKINQYRGFDAFCFLSLCAILSYFDGKITNYVILDCVVMKFCFPKEPGIGRIQQQ